MTEKRLLAIGADLLEKIDESRGDMSRDEFINLLFDSHLNDGTTATRKEASFVGRTEFDEFASGMRELMRNFLEFALSYGLELGKQPHDDGTFREVAAKLRSLSQKES